MRFGSVLVLFLVFSSQFFAVAAFAETNRDEATSALSNAEDAVISAYQTVLKTEGAGANVTDLLVELNQAGVYLARAHMEYRKGDFEEASGLANSSRIIGEEVQSAAVELKDSAAGERLQRMMFTMIASVVGMALIALGSFWVWRLFKKRYGESNFLKSN